eukprot:TRINITY_DN111_c0_g2_i3.p1 TRINITY_DN111_c0_g2~~TRINITY_DN111_c0_g2_i3.p1  ORF type:complete len:410 (+),score=56.03 TRINITY_DN111_c0_g2_i3:91-1230(+)
MNFVSPLSLLHPIVTPQLRYYAGGPVIPQASIRIVLWGNGTYIPEVVNNKLPQWFDDIVKSPYVGWLKEYYQFVGSQTTQIGLGVYKGRVMINPTNILPVISDLMIQAELTWQIEHGFIEADENTALMVYFPEEITVVNELPILGISCVTFCGYHGSFDIVDDTGLLGTLLGGGTRLNIKYGVIPDLTPALCQAGCGTGSVWEQTLQVTSHELVEILTDPRVVELGKMAWYDPINGEAADICLGEGPGTIQCQSANGEINTWSVQKIWSNQESRCIISKDFAIGLSSSNGVIVRVGQPGTAVINLTQLGGSGQVVNFSVDPSSLRVGVSSTFTPSSLNSGTTTLTISASILASTGPISIKVIATGTLYQRELPISFIIV